MSSSDSSENEENQMEISDDTSDDEFKLAFEFEKKIQEKMNLQQIKEKLNLIEKYSFGTKKHKDRSSYLRVSLVFSGSIRKIFG